MNKKSLAMNLTNDRISGWDIIFLKNRKHMNAGRYRKKIGAI